MTINHPIINYFVNPFDKLLHVQYWLSIILIISVVTAAPAQEELPFKDDVFLPTIRSISLLSSDVLSAKTNAAGFSFLNNNDDPISVSTHTYNGKIPVIQLGGNATLMLNFDELGNEVSYFYYTIYQYNRDETLSNLSQAEYIEGYNEGRITEFQFSQLTTVPYVNYSLTIPNDEIKITKSGKYLLQVYDNEGPVLTKKFYISEEAFKIGYNFTPTTPNSLSDTHQEFDFNVVIPDTYNTMMSVQETTAEVYQNGRSDNALKDLKAVFTHGYTGGTDQFGLGNNLGASYLRGHELIFDFMGKIIFPAGKEFRNINIQTLRFLSPGIFDVTYLDDGIDVTTNIQEPRSHQAYFFYEDLNGGFVMRNQDANQSYLNSEYARIRLFLKIAEEENKEIYVFGKLTDWQLLPDYRMNYNHNRGAYEVEFEAKQGFYDYVFAVTDDHNNPNTSYLEGDWYETKNEYTVMIYYRPKGGRYDQLMAVRTFGSFEN